MFSVIIPLYNKGSTIFRTVQSVLAQTLTCYEVLVVDDGSTDQGPAIVSAINDTRVSIIKQKNQGPSVARNLGVRHAACPYVAFLDGDDSWDIDYLQTIADLIKEFPAATVFASNYRLVDQRGHRVEQSSSATRGYIDFYRLSAETGQSILNASSVTVQKVAFEAIGGFNEGLRMGEDLELWCRLALENNIAFDPSPKSFYYFETPGNAMSKTRTKGPRGISPSVDFLLDAKARGEIPNSKAHSVRSYIAAKVMGAAKAALVRGDPLATLECLRLGGPVLGMRNQVVRTVLYLGCYVPVPLMKRVFELWAKRRTFWRRDLTKLEAS